MIDHTMNSILDAPFTASEIKRATFDMHPDKSPGSDGLPALFYQKFWYLIGENVIFEVLTILNEGASLESWNHAIITLIPKIKDPLLVKDFSFISLYMFATRSLEGR